MSYEMAVEQLIKRAQDACAKWFADATDHGHKLTQIVPDLVEALRETDRMLVVHAKNAATFMAERDNVKAKLVSCEVNRDRLATENAQLRAIATRLRTLYVQNIGAVPEDKA